MKLLRALCAFACALILAVMFLAIVSFFCGR
jgi:hypothetical protein